jgi:SAM-dependent methyltransferase
VTPGASLAAAYSAAADAWAHGPARIYGHLARLLVAASPVSFVDASVLDLGAGTGAGSAAAERAGGRVLAADLAVGMLLADQHRRPPATVADAMALPFAAGAFDVVLAPFSLNHLPEPSAGVTEAARVLRAGGVLLASTYAVEDDHGAKAAVDRALGEQGWLAPSWYRDVKAAMTAWGTIGTAAAAVRRGGMTPLFVERRDVRFADLPPQELVEWRLGMAPAAAFVAALGAERRDAVVDRALALLGDDPPPLVRRVIFLAAC